MVKYKICFTIRSIKTYVAALGKYIVFIITLFMKYYYNENILCSYFMVIN